MLSYDINGYHEAAKEIIKPWKRMVDCGSLVVSTGAPMSATATMPPPKKKPAKKALQMLLRLDGATADALAAYIAAQTVPPKRNPVVVAAIRHFLQGQGFWPPKSAPK